MASDSPPPPPPPPPEEPPSVEIDDMSVKSMRKVCHGRVGESAIDVAIFKAVASPNSGGAKEGQGGNHLARVAETVATTNSDVTPSLCKQRYHTLLVKYSAENRLVEWPEDGELRGLVEAALDEERKREDAKVVRRIKGAVKLGLEDSLDVFRAVLPTVAAPSRSEVPLSNASVDELKHKVAALTTSIHVLSEERLELEKKNAALADQVKALELDKKISQDIQQALRSRVADQDKDIAGLESKVDMLEARNASQLKHLEQLEGDAAAARRKLADEEERVKELETRLAHSRSQYQWMVDDISRFVGRAMATSSVFDEV